MDDGGFSARATSTNKPLGSSILVPTVFLMRSPIESLAPWLCVCVRCVLLLPFLTWITSLVCWARAFTSMPLSMSRVRQSGHCFFASLFAYSTCRISSSSFSAASATAHTSKSL